MGIQRYLFFSIHNCQHHPNVPLMRIKSASEDFLQQSGVPFTIFRLCGFMQVPSWGCATTSACCGLGTPGVPWLHTCTCAGSELPGARRCKASWNMHEATPSMTGSIVFGCHADDTIASVQAIIGNYAVPILEERQVWGTSDETRTAYMDSQVHDAPVSRCL